MGVGLADGKKQMQSPLLITSCVDLGMLPKLPDLYKNVVYSMYLHREVVRIIGNKMGVVRQCSDCFHTSFSISPSISLYILRGFLK